MKYATQDKNFGINFHISPYRIPTFNELARIDDIELKELFFNENSRLRKWKAYADGIVFNYCVLTSLIEVDTANRGAKAWAKF